MPKIELKKKSLFDSLSYVTVKITCVLVDGSTTTGTGFFYNIYQDSEKQLTVIVTNKHVVLGAIVGTFTLNTMDENGFPILTQHHTITLPDFQQRWFAHPDVNVDLCVMAVGSLFKQAQDDQTNIYYQAITKFHFPTPEEFNALYGLEDIVMVGYPNGFSDTTNNRPIFRKGITATSPQINYCGEPIFLIDSAVFPGSSGSPVFILDSRTMIDEVGVRSQSRVRFIGIAFAVLLHDAEGEILQQPINKIKLNVVTSIPNHIGLVIRFNKLFDFDPYIVLPT